MRTSRIRGAVALAILLLLMTSSATFVWARGGGGGGGHGGGGFSGGGYHGGGVHGDSGGKVFNAPVWFRLMLGGIFIGVIVLGITFGRYRLVNVVIVLRRGDDYAAALEALTRDTSFANPATRGEALHRLCEQVNEEDMVDGFVSLRGTSTNTNSLGNQANALWKSQMALAEIQPRMLNVTAPGENIHVVANGSVPLSGSGAASDHHCLVSLLVTVNTTIKEGQLPQAQAALQQLRHAIPDALYFFYCPDSGEPLSAEEAQKLLQKLRATG